MSPDSLMSISDTLGTGLTILTICGMVVGAVILALCSWKRLSPDAERITRKYFTQEDIEDV